MIRLYTYLLIAFVFAFGFACEEDFPEVAQLPALQPALQDADAGNWKTVLNVDYINSINLDAPEDPSSDMYQAELQELANITQNRSKAQEATVNYWAAGGVLRWNQIARALVSKYNVAPIVGAAPDPNKPFANPPYAARAYALLSVAQQDALITAWNLKHQYNRPAPSSANPSIDLMLPDNSLPAYPSEQAVIAEASYRVLSFIFPLEQEFLKEKAQEHKESMQWAGVNTSSDLEAGTSIGSFVAEQVIAFGRQDRMNKASDPEDKYMEYFDIPNQVQVPWLTLDKPSRKPMLPFYGLVKTWFDSTSVYAATPPPPPAIGTAAFEADLRNVREICDSRTREQWRIADFWADGGGTYTPPGHWNYIAEELIVEAKFSEVRTARTFSLMNRAMMDGGILCWYSKYKYYLPRPSQLDPKIKTATGIPNFPAYVSGHSTFSASAGTFLGYVFPQYQEELRQMYEEAGMSRVYGGIHYNCDNIEGRIAGQEIGKLAIADAQADGADDSF